MSTNKEYISYIISDNSISPDTKAITDGSLFHGYFYKYGDMWLAITFWSTVVCTLTYLLTGFIASVILRRSKLSPFIPIFSSMYGMAIGICFGGVSALIIAAIYKSAVFLLAWYQGIMWGVGITIVHIIFAFVLKIFKV